jgi:hypothetical protein
MGSLGGDCSGRSGITATVTALETTDQFALPGRLFSSTNSREIFRLSCRKLPWRLLLCGWCHLRLRLQRS